MRETMNNTVCGISHLCLVVIIYISYNKSGHHHDHIRNLEKMSRRCS